MALSDDDAARLVLLKAARDKLLTGKATARTKDASGREVEYAQTDLTALRAEIAALDATAASTTSRRRGAIRFFVR